MHSAEDMISEYRRNRSSIQTAELLVRDGELVCERDQVEIDLEDAEI